MRRRRVLVLAAVLAVAACGGELADVAGVHDDAPPVLASPAVGPTTSGGSSASQLDAGSAAPDAADAADAAVQCPSSGAGQPARGAAAWAHDFGASGSPTNYRDYLPLALAVDTNGDIVVAGRFRGVLDLGGGPLTSAFGDDVFVAKLDRDGTHLWSKRFGDDGTFGSLEYATGVALDAAGGVYLTGAFSSPWGGGNITFGADTHRMPAGKNAGGMFLAKLDRNGTPVWSKGFHDSTPYFSVGMAVTVDALGRVVMSGTVGGPLDFGGGILDGYNGAFVAAFDGDGKHVFSRSFAHPGAPQAVWKHVVDDAGHIFVAGTFQGSIDVASAADPDPGPGHLVSPNAYQTAFVAKLDRDGNHVWSRVIAGSEQSVVSNIAVDDLGELRIGGVFHGTLDLGTPPKSVPLAGPDWNYYVARLDTAGEHVWSSVLGAGTVSTNNGLTVGGDGTLYVSSGFTGSLALPGANASLTSAGGSDAYLLALDRQGNHVWSRRYGDTSDQIAMAIATGRCGELVTSGHYAGSMSFDAPDGSAILLATPPGAFTGQSGKAFVARIAP